MGSIFSCGQCELIVSSRLFVEVEVEGRKFYSHTLSLSFLCLSLYRVQDLITLGHMKQRSELVLTVAKSTGVILANFHWRRLKHTTFNL